MSEIKIMELFSGIGSQAKALKNLGYDVNTVGTCEWDIHAYIAYDAIHNSTSVPEYAQKMTKQELLKELSAFTLSNNGKEGMTSNALRNYSESTLKRAYGSLVRTNNFVDVNSLTGDKMPEDIDILTYSFPCQDLSNVGAFHGYNKGIDKDSGSRSSLLWQVGRILTEMKNDGRKLPRYLLLENVPTLLSKRHFGNFNQWINDLDELGYTSKYFRLNAIDFGLPQNRPRLLMLSVYTGEDDNLKEVVNDYFNNKSAKDVVNDYTSSDYYHKYEMKDFLRNDYSITKYFNEALECTPNDTPSRRRIWENNPQLVLEGNSVNPNYDHVRTITTKQDRDPNSGNLYFDPGIDGRSKFRYLTPRECLLFMGFTDEDYENIQAYNTNIAEGKLLFPRDKIIRMAGNSIPVKLLEGIFLQMKQLEEIIGEI